MNGVLNVAANVSRYYDERGHEVEIEIVAFNAGMHMLREDTSPVKERIANFRKSMPNVASRPAAIPWTPWSGTRGTRSGCCRRSMSYRRALPGSSS